MSQKKFTAVFQIEHEDVFKGLAHEITRHMCNEQQFHGAIVTGAGWTDEMTEADNMRAWLDEHGYDSEAIARGES